MRKKKCVSEELYAAKGDMDKIQQVLKKHNLFFDNHSCCFEFADSNRLYLRINQASELIPIEMDCMDKLMIDCISFISNQRRHEISKMSIMFLYETIGNFFHDIKIRVQNNSGLSKGKIETDLLFALVLEFGNKINFVSNIDNDFDFKNIKVIGPCHERRYWPSELPVKTFESILLTCGDLPRTIEKSIELRNKNLEMPCR